MNSYEFDISAPSGNPSTNIKPLDTNVGDDFKTIKEFWGRKVKLGSDKTRSKKNMSNSFFRQVTDYLNIFIENSS